MIIVFSEILYLLVQQKDISFSIDEYFSICEYTADKQRSCRLI